MYRKDIPEDIQERLKNGEFDYLLNKYPHIAFNIRDWHGRPNSVNNGKRFLYATEGYITLPGNYDLNNISKYDGFLTCNRKFYNKYKDKYNIIVTNGTLRTDNYYELNDFVKYEDKIKGVCSLNRIYKTGNPGDILDLRHTFMESLNISPHLVKHAYGPVPYGGSSYMGFYNFKHSHFENLKLINKYLYCFCPEPMYHELWSWDWVTERLFNCFKSKTVALYYGCYNIEQIVPKHLYIDLRDFNMNFNEISEYIIKFPKDKYEGMVEEAFKWDQSCTLGNVQDLEEIFRRLK